VTGCSTGIKSSRTKGCPKSWGAFEAIGLQIDYVWLSIAGRSLGLQIRKEDDENVK
jgi:hypothetical protein